jgi:hypothetical protein
MADMAQKAPNPAPTSPRPAPPPRPPAKVINFIDCRDGSAISTFTMEVPATSPWYDLLPDEQTIEIVEPPRERGDQSR